MALAECRPEDRRTIAMLQRKLEQVEQALDSKQHDKVAAVVRAAKPSVEESRAVIALQTEVKRLENVIKGKEGETLRKIRGLRQEHDQVATPLPYPSLFPSHQTTHGDPRNAKLLRNSTKSRGKPQCAYR